MTVKEIIDHLQAELMCGEDKMDYQLEFGFASDLMSDVLTLKNDNVLLITGLTNTQVLRTAEMSDIHCIVLARNKTVTSEMLELAKENEIAIICCKYSVFKTCGLLYEKGLQPIY